MSVKEKIPFTRWEKCKLSFQFLFCFTLVVGMLFLAWENYQKDDLGISALPLLVFILLFATMACRFFIDLIVGNKIVIESFVIRKKLNERNRRNPHTKKSWSITEHYLTFENIKLEVWSEFFEKVEIGDFVKVSYTPGTKNVDSVKILKKRQELSTEKILFFEKYLSVQKLSDIEFFIFHNIGVKNVIAIYLIINICKMLLVATLITYLWYIKSFLLLFLPAFFMLETIFLTMIACVYIYLHVHNIFYLFLLILLIFIGKIYEIRQVMKNECLASKSNIKNTKLF